MVGLSAETQGNNAMKHKHYDLCYRAHYNTSHVPEKRAQSWCDSYDEIQQEFAGNEYVLERFEKLFINLMHKKANCLSSMIVGPARFPVARAEKANRAEHNASEDLFSFLNKARKRIAKEGAPETEIRSDDPEAVTKLKAEIAQLETSQETMKRVNKFIRSIKAVDMDERTKALQAETGWEYSACANLLKPDFCGRIGYPNYMLSNNLANINRLKGRLQELENRQATEAKDIVINGVRCLENKEAMRLQLFFDGKPKPEIITTLKQNGFKWSPSNLAWQRLLNNNAVYAFNHYILPVIKGEQALAA